MAGVLVRGGGKKPNQEDACWGVLRRENKSSGCEGVSGGHGCPPSLEGMGTHLRRIPGMRGLRERGWQVRSPRDGAEWQEALCLEAVSKGGLPGKELTIAPCFWEVASQPSQERPFAWGTGA